MQWYQEKCELLALGVCPAGAFQPGGLRAHGSRFCMSMAQMVLIQSAYELIAMSLYSLARGHFSQPVVQGCPCACPADPHNHSGASLPAQLSRPQCWTPATNLQSHVHSSSIVPGSSPAHEAATQSFSIPDFCQLLLLGPVTQAGTRMDSATLVWPCCQQQETLEDLSDSMQINQGNVLCFYCLKTSHVSLSNNKWTCTYLKRHFFAYFRRIVSQDSLALLLWLPLAKMAVLFISCFSHF